MGQMGIERFWVKRQKGIVIGIIIFGNDRKKLIRKVITRRDFKKLKTIWNNPKRRLQRW